MLSTCSTTVANFRSQNIQRLSPGSNPGIAIWSIFFLCLLLLALFFKAREQATHFLCACTPHLAFIIFKATCACYIALHHNNPPTDLEHLKQNNKKTPLLSELLCRGDFWSLENAAGTCSCGLGDTHKHAHLPPPHHTVSLSFKKKHGKTEFRNCAL